jgi:predicted site-specific integrase-resolvase
MAKKPTPIPAYLNTRDVMALFGVSRWTIYLWIQKGILKPFNPTGIVNAKKLFCITENPIIMEAMEKMPCREMPEA